VRGPWGHPPAVSTAVSVGWAKMKLEIFLRPAHSAPDLKGIKAMIWVIGAVIGRGQGLLPSMTSCLSLNRELLQEE